MAGVSSKKDLTRLGKAQAHEPFTPKRQLAGSAVLVGDLEKASQEITESILGSIEKSASEL